MSDDLGAPVDPEDSEYVYVQVADRIAALIAAGKLRSGARLPGERGLAEEYGVSLASARRAVQELRDRGLVFTKQSKGTFVV